MYVHCFRPFGGELVVCGLGIKCPLGGKSSNVMALGSPLSCLEDAGSTKLVVELKRNFDN